MITISINHINIGIIMRIKIDGILGRNVVSHGITGRVMEMNSSQLRYLKAKMNNIEKFGMTCPKDYVSRVEDSLAGDGDPHIGKPREESIKYWERMTIFERLTLINTGNVEKNDVIHQSVDTDIKLIINLMSQFVDEVVLEEDVAKQFEVGIVILETATEPQERER